MLGGCVRADPSIRVMAQIKSSLAPDCTILDLYDRSVIATLNGKKITSDLAIKTLKLALKKHKPSYSGLILHSDQGSQVRQEVV